MTGPIGFPARRLPVLLLLLVWLSVPVFSQEYTQEFTFPPQKCAWIKLVDFQERFPLADNGIAEFEVYGKDL